MYSVSAVKAEGRSVAFITPVSRGRRLIILLVIAEPALKHAVDIASTTVLHTCTMVYAILI